MKKLSIGRCSFPELIEEGFIYVDKTNFLYNMLTSQKFYFLARPRRFGKSLTVSTLEEIFNGNKELFKGTYIYNTDYDWQKYPIIIFNFSKFGASRKAEELNEFLDEVVNNHAKFYKIDLENNSTTGRFSELIEKLSRINKVAILIDEYDNPIISNIFNLEKAKKIKTILKDFYQIVKAEDKYIKFAFFTGVTKFSQVSVFSALNSLTDLTMNDKYTAICGYTENELRQYFKGYFSEKDLPDIKKWYNGFRFSDSEIKVYNPWSTLNYFDTGKFKNYWFETGTPTFLIDLIRNKKFNISDKNNFIAGRNSFSTFEIEHLKVLPLLFQTGYLTIKEYDSDYDEYLLGFPNKEVKDSFIQYLFVAESNNEESDSLLTELRRSLHNNDLELFFESIDILLSKIDYDLHLKDEKYWQSLFYMILTLLGYKISAEFKTIKGRIDAVLHTDTHIYIFEFKTSFGSETAALEQIKDREYYKRFKDSSKKIVLIGSRFDIEDKKLINRYISEEV